MNRNNLSVSIGLQDLKLLEKKTLIEIFKNTVAILPDKIALSFNGRKITYKELDKKTNAFAKQLLNSKVQHGSIVGIYLPRGIDLFIAHLALLKVGATYIPFDIDTPVERVDLILNETKSFFCISNKIISEQINNISIIDFEEIDEIDIDYSNENDISHIIFTSGSTGKPKGIPIKHYQIAHFLQSENQILKINSSDIVYQGFSISFDMWFEEVWISFLNGATLIIADEITSKSFDQLESFLNINNVTILHAVPSLLAFIGTNIPTLRLINSGGEACNENVVKKWGTNNLTFYNSYGPTETTVTATIGQINIGDQINVGKPLANYSVAIVNENFEIVNCGVIGEVVIAGIGLSEGYFNNNELTKKSFIPKPKSLDMLYGDKLYLSGDLGLINQDGNILIQGRKDNQVKIRGYRIELGEIESVINSSDHIINAIVVKEQMVGIDQLIAYYESEDGIDYNHFLKEKIKDLLPIYMMPSRFIKVNSFNRLASGKIDRKKLPKIIDEPVINKNEAFSGDGISKTIYELLIELFPGQTIAIDSDFFKDLGGHSMLAAILVSEARVKTGINDISILDIYQKRTIGEIISFWNSKIKDVDRISDKTFKPSSFNYYTCGLLQLFGLFVIFSLVAAQIFIPFLSYYIVANEVDGISIPIIVAILSYIVVPPIAFIIVLLIKKLFIGKLQAGEYPLWGYVYFKWWLNNKLISILPTDTLGNTPFYNFFLRKMGAKVSDDAQLNKFDFGVADLIKIGKNVTISANVIFNNAVVENGILKISSIEIEENGYVGTSSVINGNCVIKNNGTLSDLSALSTGKSIQENEIWEGSPASKIGKLESKNNAAEKQGSLSIKYRLTFLILIFLIPVIVIIPLIPTIVGLHYLDDNADSYSFYYLYSTPVFSFFYIILFIIEVVLLTRVFKKGITIGTHSVYSRTFIKKWFSDQLFALLLIVIKPIFATVFINRIYRLLGAKVGKNTEISNASNVSHHLLEIGDESFIADVAVIGETDIRNQQLILKKTIIGNKVFVGNSAVIPQGLNLGNNKLIGVLSIPPSQKRLDELETDWFGSPAIQLPKRQINSNYPDTLTFNPSKLRKFIRGLIEFIRILIPQSLILCFSILFLAYGHDLVTKESIPFAMLLFPMYYILFIAIPAFAVTLLLKWLIIGKYRKAEYPMWTLQVWLTEAITSLYESIAIPYFLDFLQGTIFLPFFLKLLGVKIGKKIFLDTADFTEFDLVSIGDYACLNHDSGPQTHLFEDRIMKMGSVVIESNVSIGAGTIILYDSIIARNTNIESLSLVMKGDRVPANSNWEGIPIRKRN